jgi:hypothetical protein
MTSPSSDKRNSRTKDKISSVILIEIEKYELVKERV